MRIRYTGDYLPDSEENASLADGITNITRSLLSTVVIISNFEVSRDSDFSYTYKDNSAGSGVIYKLDRESGDAIIITNFHVVYDKDSITWNKVSNDIEVYLYGQEYADYKIPATFIGGSLTEDLAVLKIEGSDILKNSCAQEVIIGDSDLVSVYDKVFAVGNPEGDGMAATDGMVSVDSESLSMTGADGVTTLDIRVMRVSAAINPGNSGGGLYDESGKLVGIVNAKKTGSEVDNIAWAIPINLAKNIVDNILYYADGIYTTTGYRALLGVTVTSLVTGVRVDPDTGRLYKAEMVVISDVSETSFLVNPEDGTAPLQANDIINSITVDGVCREVYRVHQVIDHMYTARAGSTVTVNITRGERTFDVTVTVPIPTDDGTFHLTELR
jgi:serine protease Do